ncbi:MAG: helix-turn-helix domain-containing protein [Phocaeicola sp.]
MEIYERILSKEEINKRFITAANAVLMNKLISSKTGLAESLGVKPAKFSEILNGRMKAGVDMIAILCDFYGVSPDWLLMSRGSDVFRKDASPKIWVDDQDLNMKVHPDEKETPSKKDDDINTGINSFLSIIRDKDSTIIEQAEEIGRLKEQIRQMEKEKENDVQGAQTSSIANVG